MHLSSYLLLALLGAAGLATTPAAPLTATVAAHPAGQNPDCTRGAAEPVLKKSVYPKARFQLQKDKITGVETVGFANGDRLTIRNWGCESYVLTFRFETSRFQEDTTALGPWYQHAATLMTELLPGLKYPRQMQPGIGVLRRYAERARKNQNRRLTLQEIQYGADTLAESVTLDRIQKLPGRRYAVQVSFAQQL